MNQKESINLDVKLMSESIGYTLDQLMELAGQGVALCINDLLYSRDKSNLNEKLMLFLIGPGNNGGTYTR